MIPEIHNIIARWNKEAGVQNTGIKIKEIKEVDFKIKVIIFSDDLGRLIGKQGCLINKYKEEIVDFCHEYYPKPIGSVEVELTELNEIVGQDEIDVDKYYDTLIKRY